MNKRKAILKELEEGRMTKKQLQEKVKAYPGCFTEILNDLRYEGLIESYANKTTSADSMWIQLKTNMMWIVQTRKWDRDLFQNA